MFAKLSVIQCKLSHTISLTCVSMHSYHFFDKNFSKYQIRTKKCKMWTFYDILFPEWSFNIWPTLRCYFWWNPQLVKILWKNVHIMKFYEQKLFFMIFQMSTLAAVIYERVPYLCFLAYVTGWYYPAPLSCKVGHM